MNIITIDAALIEQGRDAYWAAIARHPTGLAVVPGAIIGCIERGYEDYGDICSEVSTVSRCRDSTVQTVLNALDTRANSQGLWTIDDKGIVTLVDRPLAPFTIMAR